MLDITVYPDASGSSQVVIPIPDVGTALYAAHVAMCAHFTHTGLTFTLDGKMVGDIGEAIAAEAFGLKLCERRPPGVDAHAGDGRRGQIKATGLLRGHSVHAW